MAICRPLGRWLCAVLAPVNLAAVHSLFSPARYNRAMKLAAAVLAISASLWSGPAWPETRVEGPPVLVCVSSAETRELFVSARLVPPFRVMREVARNAQAEAIDIQLCRAQGLLVYNITLLDRDGRVLHRIVNASTGAAFDDHGDP